MRQRNSHVIAQIHALGKEEKQNLNLTFWVNCLRFLPTNIVCGLFFGFIHSFLVNHPIKTPVLINSILFPTTEQERRIFLLWSAEIFKMGNMIFCTERSFLAQD
jgi:hypothetical protein